MITKAQEKLDEKRGKAVDRIPNLKPSIVLVDRLYELVLADYRDKGRKTIEKVRKEWDNHLVKHFGNVQAEMVTTDYIDKYKEIRLSEKASRATINNELAVISAGFRLGFKKNLIKSKSCLIERYGEKILNNARQGMPTEKEFRQIIKYLADDYKAPLIFAYETGWRTNSEVLTRQWRHCNLEAGEIRLEANETKNGEPRIFLFEESDPVMDLLKKQKRIQQRMLKESNRMVAWIFHCDGVPLFYYDAKRCSYRPSTPFRKSWESARLKAGLPNTIVHDFRRVTVSRYENSPVPVPRKVVKELTGHLTDSIFERYHITKREDYLSARRSVVRKRRKSAS